MATTVTPARTVWVLAASPDWEEDIAWLPPPDAVVVADGGAQIATRLGLTPALIVGDFDSCDPASLAQVEWWRRAGAEVRTYRHETKVETDTELAVLAALELRPARIYLLGATGGRIDHTLANVFLLTHPNLRDTDVRIVEGKQEIFLARAGAWNPMTGSPGDTVTLLPVGCDVTNVELTGLLYPLEKETLPLGRGRGVSNEMVNNDAAVRFESGLLLVVVAHK
jgi:thiamine pyrophosphokinase